jgi:hypothetical protein
MLCTADLKTLKGRWTVWQNPTIWPGSYPI